jgi:hypothetical protein
MARYVKPTLDTKFHIDFSWWKQSNQNLRSYLRTHLCGSAKETAEQQERETFDWISSETGEVFPIDILWHVIREHCLDDPEFFDSRVPLTTAVFRTFIANDNTPLTPSEIADRIQKKSGDTILRTIGRLKVYKGIKPVDNSI